MMWYWGGGGVHWWAWLLMTMVMIAFWAAVIWAVVALIRSGSSGPSTRPSAGESPERLLARRFAAGEIDEEEFHRRLDALRRAEPVGGPPRG